MIYIFLVILGACLMYKSLQYPKSQKAKAGVVLVFGILLFCTGVTVGTIMELIKLWS